jgi:hypothetical protein
MFGNTEENHEEPQSRWHECKLTVVHVHGVGLCLCTADTNGLLFTAKMMYEFGKPGQPRWNSTAREKPKTSEKNLSQCYFVHQISYMD